MPPADSIASRLLGVLLGVLLVCSPVVAAHHHHGLSADDHACALCNLSHAPAIATVTDARSSLPTERPERIHAQDADAAPAAEVRALPSRAPPLT